ncbi:noggin 5 [Centroberyx gerrardi]|uniref:noggin 5 n=1 Tax=Centroberyx gerrardi TaxID=166262 RepID=UPI003AAFC771
MGMLPVALLCIMVSSQHRLGAPQHLLLRPSPSDQLPVPDLREDPDPGHDPGEQDLTESVLRKRLGSNFDRNFMAVSAGNLSITDGRARLTGRIPDELRRLDLTTTHYGLRVEVGRKVRRKIVHFLWAHTRCPVAYVWKDLGARFWPRFVKEGRCISARSCSFPHGMFCRASRSVSKTLLRWFCQGAATHRHCSWIPVQYPIVSRCKCSC